MARQYLYGLFYNRKSDGKPMWAMERNGRFVARAARNVGGYVTRMPVSSSSGSWDAPTFRACSELYADYRKGGFGGPKRTKPSVVQPVR